MKMKKVVCFVFCLIVSATFAFAGEIELPDHLKAGVCNSVKVPAHMKQGWTGESAPPKDKVNTATSAKEDPVTKAISTLGECKEEFDEIRNRILTRRDSLRDILDHSEEDQKRLEKIVHESTKNMGLFSPETITYEDFVVFCEDGFKLVLREVSDEKERLTKTIQPTELASFDIAQVNDLSGCVGVLNKLVSFDKKEIDILNGLIVYLTGKAQTQDEKIKSTTFENNSNDFFKTFAKDLGRYIALLSTKNLLSPEEG